MKLWIHCHQFNCYAVTRVEPLGYDVKYCPSCGSANVSKNPSYEGNVDYDGAIGHFLSNGNWTPEIK